jgi:hypothetical protein
VSTHSSERAKSPHWFTRDLLPGDESPAVDVVQTRLRCQRTGVYDPSTQAKVRGFQRLMNLPVTGLVDDRTARAIGDVLWYGES